MKQISVILPASGNASRMNGIKKTVYELRGCPVLIHTIRLFDELDETGEIILTVKPEEVSEIRALTQKYHIRKPLIVTAGGSTRQESVQNALAVSDPRFPYVAIHDAVRPFCRKADIEAVFAKAFSCKAAALGVPVKDTIKQIENGTVEKTLERARLVAIQTPQVFEKALYRKGIEAAKQSGKDYTDDCQLIEALGEKVAVLLGSDQNFKITTPFDLAVAEALQPEEKGEKTKMRIGHGYDVHRLTEERKLILGGVEIPFEKGLLGHSDADVAVHAVMDAMLGAAALGDIGKHFPDTDPSYKNADSLLLLKQVTALITEKGYRIGNLDVTILAQAPKLAPYLEQMRRTVAAACRCDITQISIKATTEEKLGFTGSGEGIACHAVCLLL